jgi:hypothetical protein
MATSDRYNVFTGDAHFECDDGRVLHYRFRNQGTLTAHDIGAGMKADEAARRIGGGGLAARIFVGLNVGKVEKWTKQDAIDVVVHVRKKQKALPDASIMSQTGLYTDSETGALIQEPSLQIIVLETSGKTKKVFLREMTELADALRKELEQQVVILELQLSGVVTDVYEVKPAKKRKRKKRGKAR